MKETSATQSLQRQVIDAGLCTNCGACVGICPYYASWNDRTVVRDECTMTDGACHDICPRMPTDIPALHRQLFGESDVSAEIGTMRAFYVTRAADEKVRRNAQHGGTVTALVDLALTSGLIDSAVLTTGHDLLSPAGIVAKGDHAGRSSRSQFVASPALSTFNRLAAGDARSIGVVATPCQALALAKMKTSKSERIRENGTKLGLVVGLFCGWALSAAPFRDLLRNVVDLGEVLGMDIPPSQYRCLEVFTSKGTVRIPLEEVEKCVRPACRSCQDMTAEFSDISVGSARLPEGWEEAKSWNQVIVRTKAGQNLIDMAREKGALEVRDVPDGNLSKLKRASVNKKNNARKT
jgi:coenzyme F420 hydrogenase subunit beta